MAKILPNWLRLEPSADQRPLLQPGVHYEVRVERKTPDAALHEKLQHVYWTGGGSGAGKSTIARRIAAQFGLRVYATDDVMADHARRSSHEDCPLLYRFMAMDMDERWVNRPPRTMLETFHWFRARAST